MSRPVRLDLCTWPEVEDYLTTSPGIILPVGSTEQHGPMGLIGTDALCASVIAEAAASRAGALVAPTLAITPAPFNTSFPGTISISDTLFTALFREVTDGLFAQGFWRIYVLNAHGANLEPMRRIADARTGIRIRSWWDFDAVNMLRSTYYGEWEGMHATPSEVAITQARHRTIAPGRAADPPGRLTPEFIAAHAGDRHGPPEQHRAEFPDGRVGSHSALARPEHGEALLDAAADSVAADYTEFVGGHARQARHD
ncbi:MAG: creatininase family protein [Pseudomonadota bacterium]